VVTSVETAVILAVVRQARQTLALDDRADIDIVGGLEVLRLPSQIPVWSKYSCGAAVVPE